MTDLFADLTAAPTPPRRTSAVDRLLDSLPPEDREPVRRALLLSGKELGHLLLAQRLNDRFGAALTAKQVQEWRYRNREAP